MGETLGTEKTRCAHCGGDTRGNYCKIAIGGALYADKAFCLNCVGEAVKWAKHFWTLTIQNSQAAQPAE
jgi:hypothetical protein